MPKTKPPPRPTRPEEQGTARGRSGPTDYSFGWRVFEISAIAISVLVIASVLWLAIDVLLLLFGSVLLAAALRAPTEPLSRLTGLPERVALFVVVTALFSLIVAFGWLLAPQVTSQMPQLVESLGDTVQSLILQAGLEQWTEGVAADFQVSDLLPSPAGLVGGATGIISSTFGAIANLVILFVIGIYLTANPSLYVEGAARLVPLHKRERVHETLETIGVTLRWWFIGQLVSMTAVGTLTYIGLKLLGVPLAMVLAMIAFLLSFMPFIGAILAGFPVVLIALSQGADVALWTLALYALIQSFEGYVLTPLVQRHSVDLPPALTIAAQIMLGVLVGVIGIALATPLAAAGLVAIKMLYVEDVLGEETDVEEVLHDHHATPPETGSG